MTHAKYWTIFGLLLVAVCLCEAKRSDKVKLEKVQTLTLQADQWTTGRRSAPIKQLSCVGGHCGKAKVTSAQCYNRGFDGRDVQWECKAEMPANYKFGRIEVICEGYDYPEDDYVLVGSCGMEYTIESTGAGESSYSSYSKPYYSPQSISKDSSSGYWPIIVIVALIALIYFTCLRDPNPNNAYSSTSSSDDYPRPSAPPPPGFRTDYFDSSDSCSRGAGTSRGASSGGPGLFSGLAAGGLLGYLFGSSRSNTNYNTYSRQPYTSSYSSPDYDRPSTSGTSSSETRTSSGFGSTRRR